LDYQAIETQNMGKFTGFSVGKFRISPDKLRFSLSHNKARQASSTKLQYLYTYRQCTVV